MRAEEQERRPKKNAVQRQEDDYANDLGYRT